MYMYIIINMSANNLYQYRRNGFGEQGRVNGEQMAHLKILINNYLNIRLNLT